ncbi:MAG: hypothetical protein IJT04_08585 [Bacteroidales bacterium]|nr:hypothetical protein [Bacteroidales bacterium]
MQILALFNPDHDMAQANGSPHYMSPQSACKFANDGAFLLAWLSPEAYIWGENVHTDEQFVSLCQQLQLDASVISPQKIGTIDFDKIEVWGWNASVVNKLERAGVSASLLPTDSQLMRWRELSHRRQTIAAMKFLQDKAGPHFHPVEIPRELQSLAEVNDFIDEHQQVILKMPWSGSGRGVRRIDGELNEHQLGWVQQAMCKYESVLGENFYRVVQDFAMEFSCEPSARFVGYSLFQTRNGVYQHNILMSDSEIEQLLTQWIPLEILTNIRGVLTDFINQEIVPFYQGNVGVDMFVYQEDDEYKWNPVVEFNLRNTMGLLAHRFYQKYVVLGQRGVMKMRYCAKKGELYREHRQLQQKYPVIIQNHQIHQGYMSLVPIDENSAYTVQVFIQ